MDPRPRRARWAANLLLSVISLGVAFAAAEIVVRLLLVEPYDVHPRGLYTADAAVGYVPTPGFRGTFVREEFAAPVTIGTSGLRGEDPPPRAPTTFRILCLGDSFTWGHGVGDSEAFPHVLEQHLDARFPDVDVVVLNAGVPGYGTADELRYFESRGEGLDPDLVIVQFLAENDFIDNTKPALGRIEIRDGWLHAEEPPRPQPFRTIEWIKARSALARFVSERAGYLAARAGLAWVPTVAGRHDEAEAELAVDLLARIAAHARRFGAESLFVFATSQAAVVAEAARGAPGGDVVARAAEAAGAGFIDLTPALRARDDRLDLYYPLDGHWTAGGHAAVAQILADRIEERYGGKIRERARPSRSASSAE